MRIKDLEKRAAGEMLVAHHEGRVRVHRSLVRYQPSYFARAGVGTITCA